MVNDPVLAEELATRRATNQNGSPRKDFVEVHELTPEVKALGFLINMIAAMTGAKNFDYLKIHTARQEAEAKAQLEQAFSLINRLQPDRKSVV